MKEKRIPFITLSAALFFSCQAQGPSDTKKIVTDIGQGKTVMYWTKTNALTDGSFRQDVFQGQCADGGPLLMANCSHNVKAMDYTAFKSSLEGSLSHEIEATKASISLTQGEMDQVSVELEAAKESLATDQGVLGSREEREKELTALFDLYAVYMAEYQEQIGLVEEVLTTRENADLQVLSEMLASELASTRKEAVQTAATLRDLEMRIQKLLTAIAGHGQAIVDLSGALAGLNIVLVDEQNGLAQLESDFGFYGQTVANLESGIIYRVTDTAQWSGHTGSETLFGDIKPFVRKFHEIFSANAK